MQGLSPFLHVLPNLFAQAATQIVFLFHLAGSPIKITLELGALLLELIRKKAGKPLLLHRGIQLDPHLLKFRVRQIRIRRGEKFFLQGNHPSLHLSLMPDCSLQILNISLFDPGTFLSLFQHFLLQLVNALLKLRLTLALCRQLVPGPLELLNSEGKVATAALSLLPCRSCSGFRYQPLSANLRQLCRQAARLLVRDDELFSQSCHFGIQLWHARAGSFRS
mmetsp:Transcript_18963/g.44175  ORF Transcript_18963/g.44175 Transcript_18963/m.44175 type:complete len:221 (+) Transcript_18963:187-849(+)